MKIKLIWNIIFISLLFGNWQLKAYNNPKIDSLEVLLKNYQKSDSIRVDILNHLGFEYWIVDPSLSVMHGDNALTLSKNLKYRTGEAMANRVIGVADWALGNYEEALNKLFPALDIYTQAKDSVGMANVFMNIGLVYGDQLSYSQALEYYFKAEVIFKSRNEQSRLATTYTKIGTTYIQEEKFDKAFEYLTTALTIHQQQSFKYGIAETTNRLGLLFREQGDFDNALKYLLQSNTISIQIDDNEGQAKCLENIGKTYLLKGDFKKAESYLKEGLKVAEEIGSKKWLKDIYFDLNELYQLKNKPEMALHFFEKYAQTKDSLFDEKKIMEIAAIRLKFVTDRQKRNIEIGKEQIRLLEQKSRNRQLWIFLIGSLLLLISTVAYFIINRQRSKIKQDAEIRKEKEALDLSREELSKAQLENAKLKEQELNQKLEIRNKELTSYTINFIRKNELLEEINEELKELEEFPSVKSTALRKIRQKLNSNNSLDKDWEDFKIHFEEVHVGFFKNLMAKHSQLTTGDLKLAALVRMNLNLKESAAILGISPESVKTSRYRLRKKLEISQEQNLMDYIVSVGSSEIV